MYPFFSELKEFSMMHLAAFLYLSKGITRNHILDKRLVLLRSSMCAVFESNKSSEVRFPAFGRSGADLA